MLKTDEAGEIVEFKEKPKGDDLEAMRVDTTRFGLTAAEAETRPYLASMGIYVFNYNRMVEMLSNDIWVDFGGEKSRAIETTRPANCSRVWEDIGTIRAFTRPISTRLPAPNINFRTEAPLQAQRYLPPSKITIATR